jgi:hypothetical protein
VQADLVRELGPRELAHAEDVVQELDQLAGVAPHRLHRRRLLDRGHLVAHVVAQLPDGVTMWS